MLRILSVLPRTAVTRERSFDVNRPELDSPGLDPDVRMVMLLLIRPAEREVWVDVLLKEDAVDEGGHATLGVRAVQVAHREAQRASLHPQWRRLLDDADVDGVGAEPNEPGDKENVLVLDPATKALVSVVAK